MTLAHIVATERDVTNMERVNATIDAVNNGTLYTTSFAYSAAGTPLPDAATVGIGTRAFVSDADTPTFGSAYASGGATASPVYSDGTDWIVG